MSGESAGLTLREQNEQNLREFAEATGEEIGALGRLIGSAMLRDAEANS